MRCIVTSDGTRPFGPMRFMLHGLLHHLGHIPDGIKVLTGSGSHQPHSSEELQELFCPNLYQRLKIVSHDSRGGDNVLVGRLSDGSPVTMNRLYVEADVKVVLGHVEPHLFTGFTGGPKGIAPAICGLETIHRLHSYPVIDDPSSWYGRVEDNASLQLMKEAVALCPPDFLVNVVLDRKQKPVGVFSGHYIEAHRNAMELSRRLAEVNVTRRYPVVIVSNGGHPLDQNLYQAVKGIDAAGRLLQAGGTIIMTAECARGVPPGSRFETMLALPDSLDQLQRRLADDLQNEDDRWQVQRLCRILNENRVMLVSNLDEKTTRRCRLGYAESLETAIKQILQRTPQPDAIAVLPFGPQTIIRMDFSPAIGPDGPQARREDFSPKES